MTPAAFDGVIVNDASCLIDLHKGNLLTALVRLHCRLVVPLPVKESELPDFTKFHWAVLTGCGMEIVDLPPEDVGKALHLRTQNTGLSANDCFCLVVAQGRENSVLLTGDAQLRSVAVRAGVRVHGVLWIIDQLRAANICDRKTLIKALDIWKSDPSVFLPDELIDQKTGKLGKADP